MNCGNITIWIYIGKTFKKITSYFLFICFERKILDIDFFAAQTMFSFALVMESS